MLKNVNHVLDESLERYAMSTLPPARDSTAGGSFAGLLEVPESASSGDRLRDGHAWGGKAGP